MDRSSEIPNGISHPPPPGSRSQRPSNTQVNQPHDTEVSLGIDKLRALYSVMVKTRAVDERMVMLQRQGRIGFHVGSLGEEACIVGSAAAMRPQDWIFPCYREYGAAFWRGFPLQTYLHNMFGTAHDVVKGRQMPDHFTGRPYKYGSVSSPIGTQITQATGFAMAAKLSKDDTVAGVYFGDGATSSNDFHAGLTFAGVYKAPVVFLCRNNRWAISVPTHKQTAAASLADKAIGYGVASSQCDGNDVEAVFRTVSAAVRYAALGKGPTLVEMLTYRMSGHSTSDDPKAYRNEDEVKRHQQEDPITRLRLRLEAMGAWSDSEDQKLKEGIEEELRAAIEVAESAPKPSLETMFEDVFKVMPKHLERQQARCLAHPFSGDKPHG